MSKLLEGMTTLVLFGVVMVLGWLLAASHAPEAMHFASTEVQVVIIVAALATALFLVSVVALLHTRK